MLIDWFTVIAQIVNFLILVWLMKHYLYRPILAAIDAREARIAAQLKDAETKQTEADKDRAEFQQKNKVFDQRRDEMMLAVQEAASAERQKLLEDARRDAEVLRAKLDLSLENERVAFIGEVSQRVQQEVFSIARQTLNNLAAVDIEIQICKVFIDRLRALDQKQKEALAATLKAAPGPALVRSAFDLPAVQKEAIQSALQENFGAGIVPKFDTSPGLVGGIELSANGQKLAWSIDDYLDALRSRMDDVLVPSVKPAAALQPDTLASQIK